MYKYLLLLSVTLFSFCTVTNTQPTAEEIINKEPPTTFFLVRHAEKEMGIKEPSLTRDGTRRADKLRNMLKDVPLDAVYSSDYIRTKQTAQPTAKNQELEVQIYNPAELESAGKMMLEKHTGGKILVVGHSNTTPNFVNIISGTKKAAAIEESEYDNLYIVTVHSSGQTEVLQMRY